MIFEAEAILFDLNGVLANSNPAVEHAWRVWANENGLNADEIVAWSHGRLNSEVIDHFAPGAPMANELARVFALERDANDLVVEVPGAREFVASLGATRWAVATSSDKAIAEARLRKAGIRLPPVLVTAELVRRGKPDPELFLVAAARLHVDPSRCIVFEDAPTGIEAAQRAGARVVALVTTFPRDALAAAEVLVRDHRDVRAETTSNGVRLYVNRAVP
jgi:mannitol-1-/sugar-/sorbitol-6-phosphatase